MADKIDVKLVLELRQANMSQRAIAASRHISTKSVAAVWKRADALGVSYADVADKSDDEVYLLFFSDKFRKEMVYAPVNYEYVHSELKKTGVTLKLLWHEYKDNVKDGVPVGYTKFREYSAPPVEHLRPVKLNTCVAENEQCRRSSCTLTPSNSCMIN